MSALAQPSGDASLDTERLDANVGLPTGSVTTRRRWSRTEFVALALLLIAAAAIRVIWLDRIPTNLTADETDNFRTIFRIEELGKPGFFGLDWKPSPAFSMYLAREFIRVFGDTPFGLRMPSAVLSVLALIPFYALARRVVSAPAALSAAALLASGRWYLHFSRSGWENVQIGFFALLAAWAVTIAIEKGALKWFVAAGAAAALGLYGYFSGRFILPALLVYAPIVWWLARPRPPQSLQLDEPAPSPSKPNGRRTLVVGFALVTITALALYIPQIRTIRNNWEFFNTRVQAVSVFNQPRPYLGQTSVEGILRLQIERTFSGFFALDHTLINDGRYSPPDRTLLDPITTLLFLIGLALSLAKWRSTALWWCMLFVPLIGTQVFTSNTPDAARAVGTAPFFYLFVAILLDAGLNLFARPFQRYAMALLAIGMAALCVFNVDSYDVWIQSANAVEVRGPSVDYADYDRWEMGIRCELRGATLDPSSLSAPRCIANQSSN